MGKGGARHKAYYYYGTLLGAVAEGPVSALTSLTVDGVELLAGAVVRDGGEDARDFTATVVSKEPTFLHAPKGRAVIFWGTDTQDIGAVIPSLDMHPGYRGVCVLAFTGLLFGKDRTTAPNIKVTVSRAPRPPEGLLLPEDALLVDGEANPVAVMAELLCRVLGIPVAWLHPGSWREVAAACRADPERYYVSPLYREQEEARGVLLRLLEIGDAVLRWRPDGLLELQRTLPGQSPPVGAPVLDVRQWVGPPQMTAGSWVGEVPSTLILSCVDREARYKPREAKADNLTVYAARGGVPLVRRQRVEEVARFPQASRLAADWIRRWVAPPLRVTGKVRESAWGGRRPGDRVWCDLEMRPDQPESLLYPALVRRVVQEQPGLVKVELVVDPTAAVAVTAANWTRPSVEEPGAPDFRVEDVLVVPHPSVSEAVAILCERPSAVIRGAFLFLAESASATEWADLGATDDFACRMTLVNPAAAGDQTMRLSPAHGEDGPDYSLAENLPETFLDAVNGAVQMVLAQVDASGRIVTGGDGRLIWEIVYVRARTAVSPGVHDYEVVRGRRGTQARAWSPADPLRIFLFPEATLAAREHVLLQQLYSAGEEAFFRVRGFTAWGESGVTGVRFLPPAEYRRAPSILLTAPATDPADTDGAGDLAVDVTVHAASRLLTRFEVYSQRTDGSGYVSRLNQTLNNVTLLTWAGTLNFAAGAHVLTFRATDAGGAVRTRGVTVLNPGAALRPPTLNPPGREYLGSALTVTVSAAAPADRIEYALVTLGAGPPASWTLHVGILLEVTVTGARRLWARAVNSGGPETSEAVYGDYEPFDLD